MGVLLRISLQILKIPTQTPSIPTTPALFFRARTISQPVVPSRVLQRTTRFRLSRAASSLSRHFGSAEPVIDIRTIPLGDIDLQREIHLNSDTGVVNREHSRPRVRRIYSAKLESRVRKANVTVAIYQGEGAETEWRQDIARYLSVRHPNIIQVCETASSNHIHATVFYDDLIPFEGFLALYRHSALLTVYIYGVCVQRRTICIRLCASSCSRPNTQSGYVNRLVVSA
ncbi:hypothetical protein DFH08DRAFT_419937 [Mycena albidolilacea]|uniref:Protein kinase domain-containing protein n=1 Tax=Mycena albidolilacea TaxID=1033008 RepID=A0AAD7EED3_9AGAR|nr:hypothetical protein DFH08DRAFT_419937 [Mycena albidolilacea]